MIGLHPLLLPNPALQADDGALDRDLARGLGDGCGELGKEVTSEEFHRRRDVTESRSDPESFRELGTRFTDLRLEVQLQPKFSGGILELRMGE